MLELHPYQEKGKRFMDHFNGVVLVGDEMGLGKTIEVLAWLKAHPEVRPAVIISPAHLTWVWKQEAKDKFGLRTAVLSGRNGCQLDLNIIPPILILGYDVLGGVTVQRKGQRARDYSGWLKRLIEIGPKVVVWDEAHYIKNRTAKRTKSLRALACKAPHRMAVTGTALTNRPAELWPSLNLLWPTEFPNFFTFATRYCKAVKLPWGWDYRGASRLPELHQRLKDLGMLRRLKADVLKDLPPKTRHVVPVDIPMEEYLKARDNFVKWLEAESPDGARRAEAAEKIVQLGYLKRLAAEGKLPTVIQWIEDYLEQTDEKLAVYGIHKFVVRGLHERFRRNSVVIDGEVPQPQRPAIVNRFQTDKRYRLFFGNMTAAGTGITIVAAPHLMFAELSWVPGDHSQVEDRIHRIGQTKHTDITYLVARGTLEEKLCSIIQAKQEVISAVLDGKSRKAGDLDIYNQLMKQLVQETKQRK